MARPANASFPSQGGWHTLETAHMVRMVDVGRALGRILQVGAALRRIHVSGRCQELLQEGALACSMHRVR